jgi:squalene-hopene/tetraprenyl-beta-curcumene cyclase
VAQIDESLARAGGYLVARQSADGAWRSETYGFFRDGPSLTPYVLSALHYLPQAGPAAGESFDRGVGYLAGFVDAQGTLGVGRRELVFPVYTSAMASRVVVLADRSPRHLAVQRAWLDYLRGRQLNESLGWQPTDPEYGGWGFSIDVPRKPPPGGWREPLAEANLSATVFALAALSSARVAADDPAWRQALAFVERCQNYSDEPSAGDAAFDDGGFFFMPGDPAQNKAGPAGRDRHGRLRFRSYGTMTADGLRCLLRCGLAPDHPRVAAARGWLERNFSADTNPGEFAGDRAVLRDATWYYWTWAAAHAFMALGSRQIDTPRGAVDWPAELSQSLLLRQRSDGAWVNPYTDAKEDDPLVATPWAAAALAICRSVIATGGPPLGPTQKP